MGKKDPHKRKTQKSEEMYFFKGWIFSFEGWRLLL
jgi:hypothetical protein